MQSVFCNISRIFALEFGGKVNTEKLNNLADIYRDMYDSWRYLVKYNWK
jgi:hypothetical protein